MTDQSNRLALPFIAPGQAQKEMTHNEALARLDMLVQPVVQDVAPAAAPAAPAPGQSWIVGVNAADAWSGQDGTLACWTASGWRFVAPFEGMSVWNAATHMLVTRVDGAWVSGEVNARQIKVDGVRVLTARQPTIERPVGGGTIDAEARIALHAIIATLVAHGLTAP